MSAPAWPWTDVKARVKKRPRAELEAKIAMLRNELVERDELVAGNKAALTEIESLEAELRQERAARRSAETERDAAMQRAKAFMGSELARLKARTDPVQTVDMVLARLSPRARHWIERLSDLRGRTDVDVAAQVIESVAEDDLEAHGEAA